MPVTRSSSRLHGSPNIRVSSVPSGRPVRIRQPSLRLRLALESVTFSASRAAVVTISSSSPTVETYEPSNSGMSDILPAIASSPTTPPVTPIQMQSDFTGMSTSTPGPRTRQISPVTPTPVLGLHRTYASFFSPNDQQMALTWSASSMDTKSDIESTPQQMPRATTGKCE